MVNSAPLLADRSQSIVLDHLIISAHWTHHLAFFACCAHLFKGFVMMTGFRPDLDLGSSIVVLVHLVVVVDAVNKTMLEGTE
eukprot:3787285-Ditylum_brightwellii.AAC.1